MEEREFFNETTEQRTHTLTCPKCGQAGEYKVTWVVRRKRPQLPRGADERDRARFAKAQSYMVRRDDKLSCANIRCRKPFEITSPAVAGVPDGVSESAGQRVSRSATRCPTLAALLFLPLGWAATDAGYPRSVFGDLGKHELQPAHSQPGTTLGCPILFTVSP